MFEDAIVDFFEMADVDRDGVVDYSGFYSVSKISEPRNTIKFTVSLVWPCYGHCIGGCAILYWRLCYIVLEVVLHCIGGCAILY